MHRIYTILIPSFAILLIAMVGFFVNLDARKNSMRRTNSETLAIISSATAIETYRVRSKSSLFSEKIGGQTVVDRGLAPNPETSKRLKAILVSNLSSGPQPQSLCAPQPGVAIRFIQNQQSVDVLLCLQCYELIVVNGAFSGWRDFDYMVERDELIKIIQTLFPDDADIQNLRRV